MTINWDKLGVTVDVEIGVTMHIGDPRNNEYFRETMAVKGLPVHPEIEVEDILRQAGVVRDRAHEFISKELDAVIEENLGAVVKRKGA